jgi:hypothetical protein
MMQRVLAATVLCFAVVGGSAIAATTIPRSVGPILQRPALFATGDCPSYAGGTGILEDGDFSKAPDPGSGIRRAGFPNTLAPQWDVTHATVDLYGSTAWNGGPGYCSVDLDGAHRGAIEHATFATVPHQKYSVTFLFSGHGQTGCGRGETLEKVLVVEAAGFAQLFTWNTANGNDAEHGVWAAETWTFEAYAHRTFLHFRSLDHKHSSCGPVVAAVSVTKD